MATVNFSIGEQVNYQGYDAVIVSNNNASHSLTIRLNNGEIITVDSNDLFGMNQKKKSIAGDIQNRVDDLNESIEKGTQKIKYNQKLWSVAVELIRTCRRKINSLFSALGVQSENEITDAENRKKYQELVENKASQISIRNRASSDVIYYAHRTADDIFSRHRWQLQQSLVENYA